MDLQALASADLIDDSSSYETFEHESQFSIPMTFEPESQLMSRGREDRNPVAVARSEETEPAYVSEVGSPQAHNRRSRHIAESRQLDIDTAQSGDSDFYVAQQQADAFTEAVSEGASHTDDQTESRPMTEQAAATDPWQDPLPPWDYSQHEWPVLVAPTRRNKLGAPKASLVVLLIVAAAGFYFVVSQPALSARRSSAPVNTEIAEPAAAVSNPDVAESKPAEPVSSKASPSPSDAPASVDSKPIQVSEERNAQGKFSLQAAAFPTQAGADEFREKLRQAGLPSYVVSVELGRRGRWFRVRLGRFNSSEDAQKFAGEAQLRVKAAGLSLQLIGCPYEQP